MSKDFCQFRFEQHIFQVTQGKNSLIMFFNLAGLYQPFFFFPQNLIFKVIEFKKNNQLYVCTNKEFQCLYQSRLKKNSKKITCSLSHSHLLVGQIIYDSPDVYTGKREPVNMWLSSHIISTRTCGRGLDFMIVSSLCLIHSESFHGFCHFHLN